MVEHDSTDVRAGRTCTVSWPTNFAAYAAILLVGFAALVGIVLIATSAFDDPNRNNLGVGLLTGVVVGIPLIGVESALDTRRADREQDDVHRRRLSLRESAAISLASLAIDYVEQLAIVLMQSQDLPDSRAQPAGWRGAEDKSLVVRALMGLPDPSLESTLVRCA
jgi:hypothetical protein